jgi:hypothetical protein
MPRKQSDASEPTAPSKTTAARARKASAPLHRKSAAAAAGAPNGSNGDVTHEDIARLAYALWEARGCAGGSPEEDWLRAEQELLAKL